MNILQRIYLFLVMLIIVALMLFSCGRTSNRNLDIDTRNVSIQPVDIARYEQALFSINPGSMKAGLKKIAADFPVFLNVDVDDTLNIYQLHQFVTEPVNRELYEMVMEKYPDLTEYEQGFSDAFKRFRYYFPEKELPEISTYVSGLIYELPVQFFDNNMIIALDMYLGADHDIYRQYGIPLYRIARMNSDHIVKDGMYELYYNHFLELPGENVLQRMIAKGKHLYFLDAMLPNTPDHIKIGYPAEKLEWCRSNESNIWAFMVQNELLFASDALTIRKFFTDGPFTSQFTGESPARIGEWVGWQIVRSYMNHNRQVTLQELTENDDAQMIFSKSRYRPER
jgi:hypothetical protein